MLQPLTLNFILKNPEEAIERRFGNADQDRPENEIFQLVNEVKLLSDQLKILKFDKNELTSQFKKRALNELQKDQLKNQVREIGKKIKPIEDSKKLVEKRLLFFFEHDQKPKLPERFLEPLASATNHTFNIACELSLAPQEWDDYVLNHHRSCLYHLCDWQQIIQTCFGHRCYSFIARNDQRKIVGILAVTHIQSRLFGNYAVSLPYFNYGGPLADSLDIEQALLEHSARHMEEKKLSHIEYRLTRKIDGWPAQENKVSMVLALPQEHHALDKQLGSKIRAQIKQTAKHQLQVKQGSLALLDDFYTVFSRNMRDLGTPVYAKKFFKEMLSRFSSKAHIFVLYKDGKPLSAAFLLGYKNMLEIPWASTLKHANSMNANMLLYREILGYAIDQGYEFFDFGRSSKNSSTYRFKKQWGAQPVQYYWHYWHSGGKRLPELNPGNPKFNLAIKIWKLMPVSLSRLIGPKIVKDLP